MLAHRTPAAFAGVLGTLMAGRAYVPLNPTFPPERTRLMLERCGARAIVADAGGAGQLAEVLLGHTPGMLVLAPDHPDPAALAAALPAHTVLGAGDLPAPEAWAAPGVQPGDLAYVMFTSGSTGTPKGVMVSHANACHYIARMGERYELTEQDRCSQMFEPTFDVSVFDMFCAWQAGACLCCPDRRTLLKPGQWIRDSGLTLWFSAPSLGIIMRRLGQLKPGSFPALRWSLFAGEALPVELASAWQAAAPQLDGGEPVRPDRGDGRLRPAPLRPRAPAAEASRARSRSGTRAGPHGARRRPGAARGRPRREGRAARRRAPGRAGLLE